MDRPGSYVACGECGGDPDDVHEPLRACGTCDGTGRIWRAIVTPVRGLICGHGRRWYTRASSVWCWSCNADVPVAAEDRDARREQLVAYADQRAAHADARERELERQCARLADGDELLSFDELAARYGEPPLTGPEIELERALIARIRADVAVLRRRADELLPIADAAE
jgi:hypothetical protein